MAVRLRRTGQRLAQDAERRVQVAAGVVGEGLQHPDLQQAAVASGVGGRVVQPVEQPVDGAERGRRSRLVEALPARAWARSSRARVRCSYSCR